MSWTELLNREIDTTYKTTEALLDLVDDGELDWKPPAGSNWMTMGQLLRHITEACGAACRGFVTGDWGWPEGFDPNEMAPEDMIPPAENLPTIDSVAEAHKLLAEDKQLALDMVKQSGEENLTTQNAPAPWAPQDRILGHQLLNMVGHLNQHKGQLFYYLKLMDKPVNTHNLYGM